MPKLKEKHIERLMKGKKSGINVGSRQVPHHLFKYEQTQFDLAVKYGFLTVKQNSRVNLLNLWEKYCAAQHHPMLVLKKFNNGKAEVLIDYQATTFTDAKEARMHIKALVK